MTFGLCNALAAFQTFMDTEFWGLLETGQIIIYLDNILIFATTLFFFFFFFLKKLHLLTQRQSEVTCTIYLKLHTRALYTNTEGTAPLPVLKDPGVKPESPYVAQGRRHHCRAMCTQKDERNMAVGSSEKPQGKGRAGGGEIASRPCIQAVNYAGQHMEV